MGEPTQDRILLYLKTRAPLTAAALARLLAITPMGVRQHLNRLAADGLVAHTDERRSVGRPKRQWRLSEKGHRRFPDSHAEMTVELIGAVEKLFGKAGLERLVAERESATLARYRKALAGAKTTRERLKRLARLRSEEGYMSECRADGKGSYLFVENHCPICIAAKACQGFCRSELEMFQALLPGHAVERTDHVLAGARRCAYRVSPSSRAHRPTLHR